MKDQNITEQDWDNLIILDACRYDIFKETYPQFLEGELEKRKSKGSSTGEWLVKTFPEKYDIKYVTANANVNSMGVPCFYGDEKWKANNHFKKIIDVWDSGWEEELKTVPPENVNRSVLENYKKGDNTIIHYAQPHAPYVSFDHEHIPSGTFDKIDADDSFSDFLKGNLVKFGFWFEKKVGKVNSWRLRRFLGFSSRNPFEEVWRICDRDEMISYYRKNLEWVLEKVSDLVPKLEGTTIVTADHGEAFGEKEKWEHPSNTHIPVLVEIPWLLVES